jgi:hypothetical protein
VPFGANLRYWVRNRDRELACLLWTSPAWKMQPRDLWIGWSDEQRQRNLQSIVNNGRFLILPWVRVKGLASKLLALSARQMPHDWQTRYGYRPLLLETLVDAARFRGTCYRAARNPHLNHRVTPRLHTSVLIRVGPAITYWQFAPYLAGATVSGRPLYQRYCNALCWTHFPHECSKRY